VELSIWRVRKPPSSEKIGKTGTGTAMEEIFKELSALYFAEFQPGHYPQKGRKRQIGTQTMTPFYYYYQKANFNDLLGVSRMTVVDVKFLFFLSQSVSQSCQFTDHYKNRFYINSCARYISLKYSNIYEWLTMLFSW
jgi:hypothetical protein